jgi:hypothetical protein
VLDWARAGSGRRERALMSRKRRVVGIERLNDMVFRRQGRSIPGDIRDRCMYLCWAGTDERLDAVDEEEGEEEDEEKDPMAGVLFVVILLLAIITVSAKRTRSSILVLFSFDEWTGTVAIVAETWLVVMGR